MKNSPDDPTHPLNMHHAHMVNGEWDEARKINDYLFELGADCWARNMFNRGLHLLRDGDFAAGYQALEMGRYLDTYGLKLPVSKKPIYNPKEHATLRGKKILFVLEGGYGDEVMSVRFVAAMKKRGARVILSARPDLHSLFERIPGIWKMIDDNQIATTEHDYWLPGFSAAWVLGFDFNTLPGVPYLKADGASEEAWAGIIKSLGSSEGKLKIGVRWSGNPKFEHQQHRKFDPALLLGLRDLAGVQLYSFQVDNDMIDLPPNVRDLSGFLLGWEDTAAAIGQMDLMVSSCTSVAHLSAALGKRTWIVTPVLPYHCWARPGRTSPWYDSVRLFRQEKFGSWAEPFDLVRAELAEMIENREEENVQ